MMPPTKQIEGYVVEYAKALGSINAAILLNKLTRLSKHARSDGFVWMTTQELEDETAMGRTQVENAIKVLVDAGVVETKNTYITGTMKRCRHYRILREPTLTPVKCTKPAFQETHKTCTCNTKDNTKDYNKIKNNYQSANATTQPTTPPTAVAVNPNSGFSSADSKDTRKEGGVVKNTTLSNDDPFKNDIDLKKDARTKDKMRENAKAAVIATNLLNIMGKSSKRPGGKLISMVKARLAEGYTEREMALAVSRGMKVDFYKTSGIFNMLSERGMDNLLNDKWYKKETDKQFYDSIQSHLM